MSRFAEARLVAGGLLVLVSLVSIGGAAGADGGPSVSWTTTNGATVSGKTSIDAVATPSAVGAISQWCLSSSGPPLSAITAGFTTGTGFSDEGDFTFNSVTGCWTSIDSTDFPMTDAIFSFDTTTLTNNTYTYQATVTDSNNQTVTSSVLSLTTSNGGPSVNWSTPNGSTVSGKTSIDAVATPSSSGTASMSQWCLTSSGPPLSAITAGFTTGTGFSDEGDFTFNSVTGCWISIDSTDFPLTDAIFTFDTTTLANNTYTYQAAVTDSSGRTATSSVLSLIANNGGPAVKWTTGSGATETGVATFDAVATPSASGTASIEEWCLTSNDTGLVVDDAEFTTMAGFSDDGDFTSSDTSVCWSSIDSTDFPLTDASFDVDTTAATNGPTQITATVTDSDGRSSSATLSFTSQNSGPAITLTTVSTSHVSGTIQLHASAAASSSGTASMSQVCLTIDGKPVTTDVSKGNLGTFSAASSCWRVGTDDEGNPLGAVSDVLSIRTPTLRNGSHAFAFTATDSNGRTASASLTVSTSNPGARISSIRAVPITPAWNNASTKVSFWVYETNATKIVLRFGTTPSMTSSKTVAISPHSGSPVLVTLTGLAQRTLLYYQVTVDGFNGNATSRVTDVRTKAIPPKAVVVSTTCSSQEYIGTSLYYGPYYYWIYYYEYHWSNGSVSDSQTYETLGKTRPC